MSHLGSVLVGTLITPIQTITGNSGGSVGPSASGDITFTGADVLTVTGVPASNSLSVSLINGTDGQLLIGGGAAPAWASLTSSGGTITFTPGANSLNLEAAGSVSSFVTDSGTANPAAGSITLAGGLNIDTSGAGSTVTIATEAALDGIDSITLNSGGSLRTNTTATDTALLQAYDVDGGVYTTFATLTANNNPTMDLSELVTKAGGYIYRGGGTDVAVADGGSGRSDATAYAVICGGTTSTGAHQSIASVGSAGQVLTSNGAGALPTFQAAGGGGGLSWNEETGTSVAMAVNNGYITNNAALVTATLPATAAVGDVVRVAGKGAGGWRVAQNAGQTIHFGNQDTTTGAGGYLEFTNRYDSVELLCITANTDWVVLSSVGNLTVN